MTADPGDEYELHRTGRTQSDSEHNGTGDRWSGIWYEYIGKLPAMGLLGQANLKLLSEIIPESRRL
jgi:hypothetical protein